jgi:hypothetical protein
MKPFSHGLAGATGIGFDSARIAAVSEAFARRAGFLVGGTLALLLFFWKVKKKSEAKQ